MDSENFELSTVSNDELKSLILQLEILIHTNKKITDLIKTVKDLSETIAKNELKYNENIKKLEDEIKSNTKKEHQIMQLFRILNTHTDAGKEAEKEIKQENINKKRSRTDT
jgi:uncharacterized protein (UPF0335 family)